MARRSEYFAAKGMGRIERTQKVVVHEMKLYGKKFHLRSDHNLDRTRPEGTVLEVGDVDLRKGMLSKESCINMQLIHKRHLGGVGSVGQQDCAVHWPCKWKERTHLVVVEYRADRYWGVGSMRTESNNHP